MTTGTVPARDNRALAGLLRLYELPEGILPLAPRRPFRAFAEEALQRTVELALRRPQRRGMMSHAVRDLAGWIDLGVSNQTTTIEAHFDSVAAPPDLANYLVGLGFELDGFAEFIPRHFKAHYTLKYKVDTRNVALRRELRADVERCSSALAGTLAREWPDIEGYIETEIYTNRNRRYWPRAPLKSGWIEHLPYRDGDFEQLIPPTTIDEAKEAGLSLGATKRADIHAKISPESDPSDRMKLIERLEAVGFYTVRTWAGNDICTAQFLSARDSRAAFRALCQFFDENGGCSEMTLETVTGVVRSVDRPGNLRRWCLLPPLVVRIKEAA